MTSAAITAERLRQLLIVEGLTFEQVAERFGTTRNAIAGRARRAGITKTERGKHDAADR